MYYDFAYMNLGLEPNLTAQAGVEFVRRELHHYYPQYQLIDDCIAGEQRVKARSSKYLPVPGDFEPAGTTTRYKNYLERAVFYGVAGRTLDGLVGRVFTRDAVVKVPPILQPVVDDANGEAVTLDQLTQKAVATVLAKGRGGYHVDYPRVESVTAAQLASGEVKPAIHFYQPQHIINWRKVRRQGRDVLTLVVLMEFYTIEVDGFASRQAIQYRVLRLVDNVYTTELWRQVAAETRGFSIAEGPFVPLNNSGQPYNEIPFRFVGPRESGSEIEKPPLYDLCSLNMAHFRNSADYEESCYVTGQPTLWASGLTQQWVDEVLAGNVKLGARGMLPLPVDASAGLLQSEPNTMPFEAMGHKEKQMVALGAKIVEARDVQRTATEATQDEEAESSVLSSVARNVSKATLWALQWCGYFTGVPESSIEFELNTDFDLAELSEGERAQLVKEWQAEAITYSELRTNLRRAGVATLEDKAAMTEIARDRTFFAPEVEDSEDDSGEDDAV